ERRGDRLRDALDQRALQHCALVHRKMIARKCDRSFCLRFSAFAQRLQPLHRRPMWNQGRDRDHSEKSSFGWLRWLRLSAATFPRASRAYPVGAAVRLLPLALPASTLTVRISSLAAIAPRTGKSYTIA